MAHDLGSIAHPDVVREMQGQELLGASRVLGELARQKRRGVCHDNRLFGKVLLELGVELDFLRGVLGNGLDDEVGVGKCLIPIAGQLDARTRRTNLRDEGINLVCRCAFVGKPAGALGRIVLRRCERCGIDAREAVELRSAAPNGPLAAQPDGYVETAICALKRYLATQNAAACNCYLFDGHEFPLSNAGRNAIL